MSAKDPRKINSSDKRSRSKLLLKDYYGLQEGNSKASEIKEEEIEDQKQQQQQQQSQKASDPQTSADFQSSNYLDTLLSSSSLPQLMQTDMDISKRIKQLDGDMKTLVYENYEKFISATDTIKNMKINIGNMETEVGKLDEKITLISSKSTYLSSEFLEKRNKIAELGKRHVLLKKLEFIFELPERLKQSVQQNLLVDACLYYFKTNSIMERYKDLSVFDKLEKEVQIILQTQVLSKLKETLQRNNFDTMSSLLSYISCLIVLKDFKIKADGWKEFMKFANSYLKSLLSNMLSSAKEILTPSTNYVGNSKIPFDSSSIDSLLNTLTTKNHLFLREFIQFLELFHETFLCLVFPKNATPEQLANFISISTKNKKTFQFYLTTEEFKQAKSDLESFVKQLINEYYQNVEEILNVLNSYPEFQILVLDVYYTEFNNQIGLNPNSNSKSSPTQISYYTKNILQSKCNNLIQVLLTTLIRGIFDVNFKDLMDKIKSCVVNPKMDISLQDLISYISEKLFNNVILGQVQKIKMSGRPIVLGYNDILSNGINRELKEFWLNLIQEMSKISKTVPFRINNTSVNTVNQDPSLPSTNSSSSVSNVSPVYTKTILIILMSKLCDFFIACDIVQESFRLLILEDNITLSRMDSDSITVSNDSVRSDVSFVKDRCRKQKDSLCLRFIEVTSQELASMIKRSMETRNWLSMKEPKKISKLWEQVYEDIKCLDSDLSTVLSIISTSPKVDSIAGDSDSNYSSNKLSIANSSVLKSQSSLHGVLSLNMSRSASTQLSKNRFMAPMVKNSNIDKLFQERIEYFGKLPQNEGKIPLLSCIILILIKCFIETTRLRVFGRCGFQQIQVDTEFLRSYFWNFVDDEKRLGLLLDEVMTSLAGRCVDPFPLELAIVEKIIGSLDLTSE